ncbi:MAG TPA: TonB family protein [Thermoanaerobaculia bacterium]|jgi:TonB family protein
MPENILVVEYEPRYTDRVRQALTGQPLAPLFAKDGEEALRALDGEQPKLIVLSSVVPKISTSELIRAIRGRKPLAETPILLTVSGYNGKSPKADAQRMGASDILPKPYSEGEFLGKVQQLLGLPVSAAPFDADYTVRTTTPADGLTSTEIFGDLVDEERPKKAAAPDRATGNVDQMLADTLAGVMPQRRAQAAQTTTATPKPKTSPGGSDLDKRLQDTLSGLEKSARKSTSPGNVPAPAVSTPAPTPAPVAAKPPAAPGPPAPRFNTEKLQAVEPDRVPVSQPVFPPTPTPAPASKVEEDEPADGTKFGQYVLVEKIATGGMAEVWKARMRGVEGFQKIVAIKKILPHLSDNQDFISMFIDEAKLAAQLNHNNIIHIYDLGKIQSSYYIAMEYIDGYDLKTILRRGAERDNPITVELALFITSKIASALDYAHRKRDFEEKEMGIVHRDVSPQNVLISQEGDIKLCDFGIAKAASKASHTQAGALKGKLQYMSPEQAWGRAIDRRSDVFALATVLFELLTNRKLFTGDNEISILEQVREARVQPPSLYNDEVTPDIDKIVLKALQKDPANRYQSAGEMARDLDQILYSFRPTPTSADLAIFMHRLSTAEPIAMPEPEPEPPAPVVAAPKPIAAPVAPLAAAAAPGISAIPIAAAAAPFAAASAADYGAVPEPVKRKSPVVPIAIVAVLVAAGVGAWLTLGGKGEPSAPAAQTTSASALTPPVTATAAPAIVPGSDTATQTGALTSTAPVVDPSLVDQEVARRLAAERARLEAAARAQQQAATATQAPARPTPAPVTATVAQVPPPVQQPETRPAPAPVQRDPEPAPQQAAETPRQPEPAPVQRAREGDLVPVGTDGLTMPRMLRRGAVPYPAVARTQKIQGTVVTSVLVSESGSVLDVKIIRGINRPVGLNEAAEQMMRRSSFTPASKDGVRVKTWVTVPVEFKL